MSFSFFKKEPESTGGQIARFLIQLVLMAVPFFLIELFANQLLDPTDNYSLAFGALWSGIFSCVILLLPKLAGRIVFGISYFSFWLWTLEQTGYNAIFGKMMWLSTVAYAGEGTDFLGDVISTFSALWWIGGILLLALGICVIWKFPRNHPKILCRLPYLGVTALVIVGITLLPEGIFQRDLDIWGTRSEFGQSSSYRATYTTMYDAKRAYNICGLYHLTARDIWKHGLYPLTPAYREEQAQQLSQVDAHFEERGQRQDNTMTGLYQGKNVVLVLMESMDDWMITPEDTPTLYRLMNEGIQFTNFYTPCYGSARTLNSEFCMNTGVYLPTTGAYVFNYITNSYDQSIASQLTNNGYSAEVFHYNNQEFYSRGVLEPAMGYNSYNGYEYYLDADADTNLLYSDTLLFDISQLSEKFFREGPTLNTIITRSAHLSYVYNEVLSYYGLKVYPQYRGKYGSQEEDCARLKAKLVDDLFARLLQELEEAGQLENTVIVGMTDHYTYGYKNVQELLALSGVEDELQLEKTPCFIWSADGPTLAVDKTLNTADLVPTVLNLMGIQSPYDYLGQDAFDPQYEGYALFPDGSWVYNGIVCKMDGMTPVILENAYDLDVTEELLAQMAQLSADFIMVNNLLLTSDYYKTH